MAGDWIKMRTSLLTNPRVNGIARLLESSESVTRALCVTHNGVMSQIVTRSVMRHVTVSSLLVVWGAANEHTRDGVFRNADLSDVDDMVGVPGFGAAMQAVGWAFFDAEACTVALPNFNEYNTSSSERSATAKGSAERQREYRERKKSQGSDVTRDVTNDVTRYRREDKRREEKKEEIPGRTHTVLVGDAPACVDPDAPTTPSALSPDVPMPIPSMATAAGEVCRAMKAVGIADVNPSHPKLAALLAAGATSQELAAAAQAAVQRGKGFAYALGTAERQRTEAAAMAPALRNGPLPNKTDLLRERNRQNLSQLPTEAEGACHATV